MTWGWSLFRRDGGLLRRRGASARNDGAREGGLLRYARNDGASGGGLLRRRGASARNDGVSGGGLLRYARNDGVSGGGLLRYANDGVRAVGGSFGERALPCLLLVLGFCVGSVRAEISDTDVKQVTVKQQRVVNGVTNALADDAYASTDAAWTTVSVAERVDSCRFVGWEVSPAQPNFEPRDVWGRAYEQVSVVPKDFVVTFTAVYKPEGDDAEREYWYGDLSVSMDSDTDGDGYTFAEELQYGMNPHFKNELKLGGVTYGDGNLLLYNPNEYQPYVIRSEPEGELFASITNYVSPGTAVTTATYSPVDSTFAYWTVASEGNAVARDSAQEGAALRQADAFGRAVDSVTFTMPNAAVEVVAHCVADEQERMSCYWYGTATAADSDTDGDGYTFAEELQYGMNPIFKNELKLGGVTYGDSNLLLYNPHEYSPYTIRAEPTNTFATITGYLKPGEQLETVNYGANAAFAYWSLNGARQADVFGRAFDSVTLVGTGKIDGGHEAVAYFNATNADEQAIAYWYGLDSGVTMDSDTDGDGYTFAEEMQYGMNPHFKNELKLGGVTYGDGPTLETNLQPFDLGNKALVDGKLTDFFAQVESSTGNLTGGLDLQGDVATAILDENGDGLFDLIVYADGCLTLYRNKGAQGSPDFEVVENPHPVLAAALAGMARPILCGGTGEIAFCDNGGAVRIYDLAANTIAETELVGYPLWDAAAGEWTTLAAQTLDVGVQNVTSATMTDLTGDGVKDLLVADADGRIGIWTLVGDTWTLQHRVWGGSYIGFAPGLTLAPVDWDGDGDVDMVCGTSDGHLLLLRDPNVGAPSNLRATAGFDNVVLDWDPNGQSRVYGYKAYRATAVDAEFAGIAQTQLPTYRDQPPTISTWAYYVTALSRLWTAGNSKPEEFESKRSNIVTANLGGVALTLPETMTSYDNADITLPIRINNSMGIAAKDLVFKVAYDPNVLTAVKVETSALSEGLTLASAQADGVWTLSSSGGTMTPGSGALFTLHFTVKRGAIGDTTLSLTEATLFSLTGVQIGVNTLPVSTILTVKERATPAVVTLKLQDQTAKTGDEVSIPVEIATTQPIKWETLTLAAQFDETKLEQVGGIVPPTAANPRTTLRFKVLEQHGDNLFAEVTLSGAAVSANGLSAVVPPATCRLIITDSNPPVPAQVTLGVANVSAETLAIVDVPVTIETDAAIDWSSVHLTAQVDAAKLEQVDYTAPTAANPTAVFRFKVLAQRGVDLFADVMVSGSATSANGLPANVAGATGRITITDGEAAEVTLNAPTSVSAETRKTVTVNVSVATLGCLDWKTLNLTATMRDGGKLTQTGLTPPTKEKPVAVFTFTVAELHGANLSEEITFGGTATSVNGKAAIVHTAKTIVNIIDGDPAAVTLAAPAPLNAETLTTIDIPVTATNVGELDWSTLKVTAKSSADFVSVAQKSVNGNTITFTATIVSKRGVIEPVVIAFDGTATGANGIAATVAGTSCTLNITDGEVPIVTLASADKSEIKTLSRIKLPIVVTSVGELDWSTVSLAAEYDAAKLAQVGSAVRDGATQTYWMTFDVLDFHEGLSVVVTFRALAKGANGRDAVCSPAVANLTFIDVNPPQPAVVSLLMENMAVMTETTTSVVVRVTMDGEIDWNTLALTPTFDGGKLRHVGTTVDAARSQVSLTFDVLEQHGDDLSATIAVTGTVMSANGLEACVTGASCTLAITDSNPPKDPTDVGEWENGDCTGDGKLTWHDWDEAYDAILKYHSMSGISRPPAHSEKAQKIHNSLLQALSGELGTAINTTWIGKFGAYIRARCGERK